ncbi:methionyl aminopeptidase [Natranaerovirga hydrolytica]|uniref:Methionine aminopeptidase n=1 Tax=Natranaerovirga hydrolytica TaxID=680378 RepID=A0A4R1ML10_9FIRM|nr:type I methionyl aminopeptidase [Natranaerovirga hydrolytica]TCK93436.1 methionyl aminopeptidase [Natranaerovirga hydrolytica]
MPISIKSNNEIELMREAGQIVARTHELLKNLAKPGISTWELDKEAEKYIKSQNAFPSFKGYMGFPSSICASINNEVVHGIPSKKNKLKDGDIISIDIGALYKGYHGDAARTLTIGNVSDEAKKLIKVTEECFFKGMEFAKSGCHLFEISATIQEYVEAYGYSVVRDLVGHGIGKKLHEEPQIPNFKQKNRGPKLEAGMVLAIEPMINAGMQEVRWLDDDWTVVTMDGSLSAHYENTVLIKEDGYELLTVL